jgi:aspartyl-tRNA(Asn)/glutamyl-tRNA(Gln) amidotransferase subunit A
MRISNLEPYELSLAGASKAIATGELTPLELTQSVLKRIDLVEDTIGAFATVTVDHALSQAKVATAEIEQGNYRGPLHGIPVAVKDLINTAGIRTTSSSKVRENYIPSDNATVVDALEAAGMVIIGKTHTHEFAFGATTPTTRNPWNTSRIPGGSSGGSAAAVAYGGCLVALGSDTGGSIRIPAALCGTVGLKPTYGRVSRAGVASLSWSLDHVGPLTRNVTDAALMMNVLAGYDRRDPGSANVLVPDFAASIEDGVEGLRIGIPVNFYTDGLDPETSDAVANAVKALEGLGATVVPVTIPFADDLMAAEYAIMMPEASAYHRRAMRETPDLFSEDVRTLLEIGETILATDYIDGLRLRQLIQNAWRDMMQEVDVIIAPTCFTPALPVDDPVKYWPDGITETAMNGYVRLSMPANLTGLPALQVPVGFSEEGLPIGMQIIGKPFAESTLLTAGRAFEKTTDVVGRIAPVSA